MTATETPRTLWKIGSRWNATGAPGNSVLGVFNRHQIVFVGSDQDHFARIQMGDLLAITDGALVVAIGEATSLPQAITEMSISFADDDEAEDFCYAEVLACKARIVFLKEPDRFQAFDGGKGRRGAAFRLPGQLEHVKALWDAYRSESEVKKEFSIKARSCTLLGRDSLLDAHRRFLVPVYQRPYSWTEEQVRKLLSDLLLSFRGTDGNASAEPIFIGAMQISGPKKMDTRDDVDEHDIVDGQQRLSTLLVLLKVIQSKCADAVPAAMRSLGFGWLRTDVDRGAQQRYLHEFLVSGLPPAEGQLLNPYQQNAILLERLLADEIAPMPADMALPPLDLGKFAEYLLTRVYFVVIETQAGLSKTLQIFKAINTAGLDLNGDDIFKLRFYEYLRDVKGRKDASASFEEISGLYECIDTHNRKLGRHVFGMSDVLAMYQQILVARHELPVVLHTYGTDTFFQRLFDVILHVDKWDHFQSAAKVEVSLEDLRALIDVRFHWEQMVQDFSEETKCSLHFIWWSRYGKYSLLPLLFCFRYGKTASVDRLVRQLAKLLITYSVYYRKAIYEISYGLWADLAKDMFAQHVPAEDLIAKLDGKTRAWAEHLPSHLDELDIACVPKAKNLLCRLSAMLDEDDLRSVTDNRLVELLFQSEIDIEHIEPSNNKDGTKREAIWEQWGDELNRIGNLMVLEQGINRSIQNEDYEGCKIPAYARSRFQTVRDQARSTTWDLSRCLDRKKREVAKIVNYLLAD